MWLSFLDMSHISGFKLAIFESDQLRFLRAYTSLKQHILFYSNV